MTNPKQISALTNLKASLQEATETGLLDVLNADMSDPDAINEFCDAVDAINKAEMRARSDVWPVGEPRMKA